MNPVYADGAYKIIYRLAPPTHLDVANYNTLCQCQKELYIQKNIDPDNPKWEYLGKLESSELLKVS